MVYVTVVALYSIYYILYTSTGTGYLYQYPHVDVLLRTCPRRSCSRSAVLRPEPRDPGNRPLAAQTARPQRTDTMGLALTDTWRSAYSFPAHAFHPAELSYRRAPLPAPVNRPPPTQEPGHTTPLPRPATGVTALHQQGSPALTFLQRPLEHANSDWERCPARALQLLLPRSCQKSALSGQQLVPGRQLATGHHALLGG